MHRSTEPIQNLEVDPQKHDFLIHVKKKFNGERIPLSNKWCWNNWISVGEKMNFNLNLTFYTKNNLKETTDLNVKCKTTKYFLKK